METQPEDDKPVRRTRERARKYVALPRRAEKLVRQTPGQIRKYVITHRLMSAVIALIAIALIILGFVLPWIFTGSFGFWRLNHYVGAQNAADKAALVSAQIQASVAFVQLIGGFLLIWVIYTGYQTMLRAQEQVELGREQIRIAQEGQITDRFTKAIEQLGSIDTSGRRHLEIRLGGIYALERIAKDSPRDYWTIMKILTAYIRENTPASRIPKGEPLPNDYKPRTDIQAIITGLGCRTKEQRALDAGPLDLCGTDLRKVNLQHVLLEDADLRGADLSNVKNLTQQQIDTTFMDKNTILPTKPGPDGQPLHRSTRVPPDENLHG